MSKKSSDAESDAGKKRASSGNSYTIPTPEVPRKSDVSKQFLEAAVDLKGALQNMTGALPRQLRRTLHLKKEKVDAQPLQQPAEMLVNDETRNNNADSPNKGKDQLDSNTGNDGKQKHKKKRPHGLRFGKPPLSQATGLGDGGKSMQLYNTQQNQERLTTPTRQKETEVVGDGEQKPKKKSKMKHVVNAAMLAVGTVSPTAGIGMAAKYADKKLNEDGVTKSLKGKKGSALKGLAALVSPTAAAGVFLESKRHTMIRKVDDATSMKELAGKTTQGMKKMFAKSPKKSDSENVAKPSKGALRR